MTKTIAPLEDRILVRPDESESMTAGGIILPEAARAISQTGTVLAVGPGKRCTTTGERVPLDVVAGDRVLFGKYGGTEITSGGQELRIVTPQDVLAIVH